MSFIQKPSLGLIFKLAATSLSMAPLAAQAAPKDISDLIVLTTGTITKQTVPAPATDFVFGADVDAPPGYIEFCKRYVSECKTDFTPWEKIALDSKAWKTIVSINKEVNDGIMPMTDEEQWGKIEQWDIATINPKAKIPPMGDCEDYALTKRKMLIDKGIPSSALFITVVKDKDHLGHALLAVRTDKGVYILDNINEKVVPLAQSMKDMKYTLIKTQSPVQQNVWVAAEVGHEELPFVVDAPSIVPEQRVETAFAVMAEAAAVALKRNPQDPIARQLASDLDNDKPLMKVLRGTISDIKITGELRPELN